MNLHKCTVLPIAVLCTLSSCRTGLDPSPLSGKYYYADSKNVYCLSLDNDSFTIFMDSLRIESGTWEFLPGDFYEYGHMEESTGGFSQFILNEDSSLHFNDPPTSMGSRIGHGIDMREK